MLLPSTEPNDIASFVLLFLSLSIDDKSYWYDYDIGAMGSDNNG